MKAGRYFRLRPAETSSFFFTQSRSFYLYNER